MRERCDEQREHNIGRSRAKTDDPDAPFAGLEPTGSDTDTMIHTEGYRPARPLSRARDMT
jgi:hypothetical protein